MRVCVFRVFRVLHVFHACLVLKRCVRPFRFIRCPRVRIDFLFFMTFGTFLSIRDELYSNRNSTQFGCAVFAGIFAAIFAVICATFFLQRFLQRSLQQALQTAGCRASKPNLHTAVFKRFSSPLFAVLCDVRAHAPRTYGFSFVYALTC